MCKVLMVLLAAAIMATGCSDQAFSSGKPESPLRKSAAKLLASAQTQGSVRVLVQVRESSEPEGSLSSPAARTRQRQRIGIAQAALLQRLAHRQPKHTRKFESAPVIAMEVDAQTLEDLMDSSDVAAIEEDLLLKPEMNNTKTLVGATTAWSSNFTGYGQYVAIADTGVYTSHSYFSGKIGTNDEACYGTTSTSASNLSTPLCPGGAESSTAAGSGIHCTNSLVNGSALSGCDHGTHVAGIAAGYHNTSGTNYSGLAKDANIIALQVFSEFQSDTACGGAAPCILAWSSDWLAAAERVLSLAQAGKKVASFNMSLGGGSYTANCDSSFNSVKLVLDNLVSAGIAVIASSGNSSYSSSIGFPACLSNIISVGATTKSNVVDSYSNSASILSILAPGSSITAAGTASTTATTIKSGTSMAAPHVTGAFAILKSAKSDMTVAEGLSALQTSGLSITDSRNAITKPRITINSAIALLSPTAPSFSPAAGTYTSAQSIVLSSATANSQTAAGGLVETKIYYTTDGSTPTTSSTLYTGAITIPLDTTRTIKALTVKAGLTNSAVTSATYTVTGTVATPSFSVSGGTYTSAQTVSLSTTTSGATIYYTLDGSTPTTASSVYSTALTLPTDTVRTLKAIATKTDWLSSSVAAQTYTITGTVSTPTFSITAGTYTSAQSITLSASTSGATIYYTTNGSTPTTASTVYSGAITVPLDTTMTLQAIAAKTSWITSAVASSTYVVTGTVASPTFSLTAGTYTSAQTLTLSTSTPGATIHYTTDGSVPTTSSPTYTTAFSLPLNTTITLRAFAVKTGWTQSGVSNATYEITGTVATPSFGLAAGTYTSAQTVSLSSATSGASFYYTIDGSTPTALSTLYTGAIVLPLDSTIPLKVVGVKSGWLDSAVASATYLITGTVAAPVLSLTGGTYTSAQTVSLSTATPGATIYYTTDGSTPTTGSTVYTTAITLPLDSTTTVKAFATKTDWVDSSEASASYLITGTVAVPTFGLSAGTYRLAQTVSLSCTTSSATIHYTTDGSEPTTASPVYSTDISLPLHSTVTLKAIAARTDWTTSSSTTATYVITGTVDAPSFSLAAGTYTSSQSVSVSSGTSGANIYYTTDGSAPTASATLYTGPLTLPLDSTITLKAIALKTDWDDSAIVSRTYVLTGTVAAPDFSLSAGSYSSAQTVTMATPTPGATLHYTTDGSSPTTASPIYAGPIDLPVETTITLKAMAVKTDWADSPQTSATYEITNQVAAPVFQLSPGTYTTPQAFTVSSVTAGATLHYTLDGSTPTTSAPIYTGAIALGGDSTTVIKVLAVKTNWANSTITSGTYVITGTVVAPLFSIADGTYTTAQNVTLSSATAGATIYYTLDGTSPTAASTVYTGAINIPLNSTRTLRAFAQKTDWVDSAEATVTVAVTGTVDAPLLSLAEGTYTSSQSVTLSCLTPGATIYYTLDGSTPTTSSNLYFTALTLPLNSTVVLKALAVKSGWDNSPLSAANYLITGTVAAPTFSVTPGTFTTAQTVTLASSTSGATIYYTTDGTTPTTASPLYAGAITLPVQTTVQLQAIAVRNAWDNSSVTSGTYTITDTVAIPALSVAAGTYFNAQTVALSTSTPGATIYYTTDGSTPTTSSSVYSTPITVPLETTVTLKALATRSAWGDSAIVSATYVITNTVPTPLLSLASGTYTTAQDIVLSTSVSGATIYYTLDGSTPTMSSAVYTTAIPLPLDSTWTLKAFATKGGWLDSNVSTGIYTITGTVSSPTFSLNPGTYTSAQTLTLSTTTSGATVYYTLDGSTPTSSSLVYSGALTLALDTSVTVKAIAARMHWTTSAVASAAYVITGTVATPTFSVAAGTYATAQTIALSTATSGATIRYTLDGSTPTAGSTAYSTPLTVPLQTTRTFKAMAFKSGWADSAEASGTYVITDTVTAPVFSITGGTYTTAQTITLSSSTSSAAIYYTTDGSIPTTSSTLYSGPLTVPLDTTRTIRAIATRSQWTSSSVVSQTYTVTGTVAAPSFSVAAGTYTTAQNIALSTNTPGAAIYYTTDGSPPTASSTLYTAAINLPEDTTRTVRAIATKSGWTNSPISEAAYVVTGTVATPTFSPGAGSFNGPQNITLSTTTSGATIRYTTDGTTPTTTSTVYTSPIAVGVATSVTVRARAFKSNWTQSALVSGTFTVVCTRNNPTLAITPSAQSSAPGAAQTYTFTVTNQDTGCADSTFDLTRTVPSGWSSTLSSATVSLSPGQTSAAVTFTVTSPTTATASTQSVSVTATNRSGGASGSASAQSTLTCTPAAPTLVFAPMQLNGVAGSLQTYTLTLTNNDVGCAVSTFQLARAVPASWTGTLGVTSLDLASSAQGTTTLEVTSAGAAALGSSTVSVTLTRSGGSGTSGAATYTVVPACVRHPPTLSLLPSTRTGVRGAEVSYTATLTNNDVACSASTLTPSLALPNGWTGTVASTVSVASGASTTLAITVTSSLTAAIADHEVTLTVGSPNSGSVEADVTYTTVLNCVRGAPKISLTPASQAFTSAQKATYAVQVTNNDNTDCGTSSFGLSTTLPSGWSSASSAQTLAPGSSASFSLEITPPPSLRESVTPFTITARNGSVSTSQASANATYTLGCQTAPPLVAIQRIHEGSYSVKITNQDPTVCADATYVVRLQSEGLTLTPSQLQLLVGPGQQAEMVTATAEDSLPGEYTLTAEVIRPDGTVLAEGSATVILVDESETVRVGCSSGGGFASGWLFALALIPALRRRRKTPSGPMGR